MKTALRALSQRHFQGRRFFTATASASGRFVKLRAGTSAYHGPESVEKNINRFRERYGILSECAHPNYAGTMGLYATNDTESILTDFGPTKSLTGEFGRNTKTIGLLSLSSVLMMFPAMYQNVGDVLPEFVKLCEDALSQKGSF